MLYVRFSAKFSTSSFIRFTNLYEIDIIISTLNQETQSNREKLNCACTHTHTHTERKEKESAPCHNGEKL